MLIINTYIESACKTLSSFLIVIFMYFYVHFLLNKKEFLPSQGFLVIDFYFIYIDKLKVLI